MITSVAHLCFVDFISSLILSSCLENQIGLQTLSHFCSIVWLPVKPLYYLVGNRSLESRESVIPKFSHEMTTYVRHLRSFLQNHWWSKINAILHHKLETPKFAFIFLKNCGAKGKSEIVSTRTAVRDPRMNF